MKNADFLSLQALFDGRRAPRRVPLGWDWFVLRCELLFEKKLQTSLLLQQAHEVLRLEKTLSALSLTELQEKLDEKRILFRLNKESLKDYPESLAVLGEIAHRIRKERPYKTQIAGALGILHGCIVEMATGEGKTLTASLAAIIAAWRGKGCHVVTSNDYLAARDAEILQDFYKACLVTCASITQESKTEERQRAYAADITYLTSKEAAADFLRDQMNLGESSSYARVLAQNLVGVTAPTLVQRGLHCAIVDEADSVLCDGGNTPLIISTPRENAPRVEQYVSASHIANAMKSGKDFRINRLYREVKLTDLGKKTVLQSILPPNTWAQRSRAIELVTQALEAREFFKKEVHYIVHEEKVVIVDESTGRIMPDHEWRDGLHQAVAAKEGVEVIPPRSTSAQTTFQDFFLRYHSLSGMTGTAWEARKEFLHFYRKHVVRIPTYRPTMRTRTYRAFHRTEQEKFRDIVACVQECHKAGRPVLVGTKSIKASESISAALSMQNINHEVLNALQHDKEADIIARAGAPSSITVATNMAGRGTDIKLSPAVRDKGGLHVILTEMHSSARIDRQLYGRCARQGDPGTYADIISMEDDLFFTLPPWLTALLRGLLRIHIFKKCTHALLWRIARLCQYRGDARARRMRKAMIKNNHQFEDMISYSGKRH